MGVLYPRRAVRALVHHVGLRQTCCDVSDLTVQFEQDIVLGIGGERIVGLVQLRSAGRHGLLRIEHRGQQAP
jgi:hypothetical protein